MELKEIRIKKDGKWYFGGAEMFRREIVNILSSNIFQKEDGSYHIQLEEDSNPIVVEDVPFFATGIVEGEDNQLTLSFHDLQKFTLDREMPLILKGDVPYISFKWHADTRLSRGVYWKLSDYFEFRGEDVFIVPPGVKSKLN